MVPEKDDEWPLLEEILDFRDRVRNRLRNLYKQFESGERDLTMRRTAIERSDNETGTPISG